MNSLSSVRQRCPYCGQQLSLSVDCSVVHQDYIEDCHVCCQPINVTVQVSDDGEVSVSARRDDD